MISTDLGRTSTHMLLTAGRGGRDAGGRECDTRRQSTYACTSDLAHKPGKDSNYAHMVKGLGRLGF